MEEIRDERRKYKISRGTQEDMFVGWEEKLSPELTDQKIFCKFCDDENKDQSREIAKERWLRCIANEQLEESCSPT